MTTTTLLNTETLNTLSLASRNGVERSLHRVATNLPGDAWLPISNVFHEAPHEAFDREVTSGRLSSRDLAEFIAISAPVHCMDGWSLIGKALHVCLRGNPYIAVHLAHYAELRAALAILATEGIGIFSRQHYIVDMNGTAQRISQSETTHRIVWPVLNWWVEQTVAIDLLSSVISPNGIALKEWVQAYEQSSGAALRQLGMTWLLDWGLDLQVLYDDQTARNYASYWPNTVVPWNVTSFSNIARFLENFWIPMEPLPNSRFDRLDKHFLRIILEAEYKGLSGRTAGSQEGSRQFAGHTQSMLENLLIGPPESNTWMEFLARSSDPDNLPIIEFAASNSGMGQPTHAIELISRATLLLRIATGSCQSLLQATMLTRDSLSFWIDSIGIEQGIWHPNSPPDDYLDLWLDIEMSLEDVQGLLTSALPDGVSPHGWWDEHSSQMLKLEESERVAMWGLGL